MIKNVEFDEILSLKPCKNLINSDIVEPVVLYGAGVGGEYFSKLLKTKYNIIPAAICDTYKAGQEFMGYKVCTAQDVKKKFDNAKILITSLNYYYEIKQYLLNFFSEDQFIVSDDNFIDNDFLIQNILEFRTIYSMLEDQKSKDTYLNIIKGRITGDNDWAKRSFVEDQYFCNDLIQLSNNESFVDAGAYIGDTLELFIKLTNNKFNNVYCFEPSGNNFDKLTLIKKKYNDDSRIKPWKAGLYSENCSLGFEDDSLSSSNSINSYYNGKNTVDVFALDKIINDQVTFIKMDIEGAELDALKGAKQMISNYKPKLAICIYHNSEHFITIPNYIRSLRRDYKFYVRHHSNNSFLETVLYAL